MKYLICGFGHAGRAYFNALEKSANADEIYIFDPNEELSIPDRARRTLNIDNGSYYDVGIIATPPASHLDVLELLQHNCGKVIVEKPISTCREEHGAIMAIAANGNVYFSLHAHYGKELDLLEEFDSFSCTNSFAVSHFFSDPYGESKGNLGGPFWDSIYNVLSVFYRMVGGEVSLVSSEVSQNDNKVFSGTFDYLGCKGQKISQKINIVWDFKLNQKLSQILQGKACFTLNHSNQSLYTSDGLVNKTIPYQIERLAEHYSAVIEEVVSSNSSKSNNQRARDVASIVWDILDKTHG